MTSSTETEKIPEWCRTEDIPSWLHRYFGIEESATKIWIHSPFVIGGLFQIPEYSAAIARSVGVDPTADDYIDRTIRLRKLRQRRLNNGELTMVAIHSEFSLRSKMGSNASMAEQMARLVKLSEKPNVTLLVVPFTVGQYEALRIGSYAGFSVPGQSLPIMHTEGYNGGRFIEQPEEIAHFNEAFEHARQLALPANESRKFIADIGKEWESRSLQS